MCVNYKVVYIYFKFYFMCMVVLSTCMCIMFMPGAHRGQKRVLDLLELESQVIVTSESEASALYC